MGLWEDIVASLDIEPTNEAQGPIRAENPIPRSVKAPAPGKGTFFDEHIDLRDPEGERLSERLVECFDKERPKQRKRLASALVV